MSIKIIPLKCNKFNKYFNLLTSYQQLPVKNSKNNTQNSQTCS